ncbi:MAG: DUF697 domain-containing protein [Candidatus Electrothrix sp. EH2]|nr:DUF697 domain-containing protein [Candidatus Electrothrix sp. EH2]
MIIGRDRADLKRAKALLEKDSVAVRLATLFGDAAENIVRRFSRQRRRQIEDVCLVGLEKTWEFSLTTLSAPGTPSASKKQHRRYAILSGAVGGAGIATLFAELPVTTVIMMRAIADVAKSEGEDFHRIDTKRACLQVFALGGDNSAAASCTSGYYASRDLLAQPFNQSARYVAKKGAAGMGAPFAVQLIAKIAVHYQTWLSARTAAAAVPIAGAVMGAGINVVYLNYLHDKAQGHFIIRRLEKKYGPDRIAQEYSAVECGDRDTRVPYPSPAEEQVDRLIRKHVYASLGSALLPIPLVDFILATGIQLNLLKKLSALYNVPFFEQKTEKLIGILIGGTFSSACAVRLGASIAKFTPVIAYPASIATVSATAAASTYAIGKVFNRHFAQGGTFLTFDPKAAKTFYAKMFTEGKKQIRNENLHSAR